MDSNNHLPVVFGDSERAELGVGELAVLVGLDNLASDFLEGVLYAEVGKLAREVDLVFVHEPHELLGREAQRCQPV